ncbi:uncharacterized protein BDZ99DRAFT_525357 [Mytilinidion resinicola]|uniref:F-box domain-containing protein n=1 Tax=Mytilinidion resinicola TaxID=574789 RepID=A0A6A6Y753_9PEZI|nr:uncharacterized protein BDZ99DRAFT_525357 [Mytilinidion resinicola]KAF2804520.1 hypothetical protein BDZ99DRAFT_525357 [Mytilinidion resinicola]
MGFLDVATEIRLKIYSELLVLLEPIKFVANFGPPLPPLLRSRRDRLHPAVLRLSSKVYNEASPLLYSKNRFQFPEVFGSAPSLPIRAHVAPFLIQIGSQSKLIHHICIPFPTFNYPVPERARLDEVHIENLELIRKTCTNIKTLELLVPLEHCNYALDDWAIASEALDLLNTRFKAIHSLKEIMINFEEYPEDDPSDGLTKKMRDIGWTVRITRLPKRVWISIDDRVEFDNEEVEMEEETEKEQWLDEYYRRRHDPYWENDSDYD